MIGTLLQAWGSRASLWLALVALFGTACVLGSLSPYLAIIAVLVGFCVFGGWHGLGDALRDPAVQLFLVAFVLLVVAFALSAQSPTDLAAIGDFLVLPLAALAYAVFRRSPSSGNALTLAFICLAGVGLALLFGFYEVAILHTGRATGGFSAIFYSDLAVALGFTAFIGLVMPGPRLRMLLLLGPAFAAASILLGGTRGALAGASVMAIVAIIAVARNWRGSWRILVAMAVIAVIAAMIASQFVDAGRVLGMPRQLWESLVSGRSSDASLNYRYDFFAAGLQAFQDSPVFGHGWWRKFAAAVPYMSPEAAALQGPPAWSHLHSDAMTIAVGAGTLGIAAYLLILVAPTVSALRSPRDSQYKFRLAAVLSLSLGFLAFGLSDSVFVFELGKTFYILGSVAILGFCRDEPLRA